MRNSAFAFALLILPASAAAAPLVIQQGTLSGNPAISWNGSQYLVAWTDTRQDYDIYFSRVTAQGVVTNPGGIPLSNLGAGVYEGGPNIASDGQDFLVVWRDFRGGLESRIFGARVRGSDGAVLDPVSIQISDGGGEETTPVVVWRGDHYLVAWDATDGGAHSVQAARVGADGTVIDSVPLTLVSGTTTPLWPSLAFDGTATLLAVGAGNDSVFTMPISQTGEPGAITLIDGLGLSIPRVIADDGGFQVVWGAADAAASIRTRFVGADGVLGTIRTIATVPPGLYLDPALFSAGDGRYLVAWTEGSAIRLARVDECGPPEIVSLADNTARPVLAGPEQALLVSAGASGVQASFISPTDCRCNTDDDDDGGGNGDDDDDDRDDGDDDDDEGNGDHGHGGQRSSTGMIGPASPVIPAPGGCAAGPNGPAPGLYLGLAALVVGARRRRT